MNISDKTTKNYQNHKHLEAKPLYIRLSHYVMNIVWLIEFFFEYVWEKSTTHGVNHFVAPRRHASERLLWKLIVLSACFALFYFIRIIKLHFDQSPTVISIERDYLSWNNSFPSATMCVRDVDMGQIEKTMRTMGLNDTLEVKKFLQTLILINLENLEEFNLTDHPLIPPTQYANLLDKLHSNFTPQVLSSIVDQEITIHKTMTEFGLCHVFNSQIALYNSPSFWAENKWNYIPKKSITAHQLDGDLFIQLGYIDVSYYILFHGPRETPQLMNKKLIGSQNSYRTVILEVLSTYSTKAVRALSMERRRCRSTQEKYLSRSPVYSYGLCILECRAKNLLKLCGCLPHFYRPLPGERICSISELSCARDVLKKNNKKVKKGEQKNKEFSAEECVCVQNCDEDFYTIQRDQFMTWDRETQLTFSMNNYPKQRIKRDVLFGVTNLLVQYGGTAGLLFGVSVLSVVEIVYLITARLVWFLRNRKQIWKMIKS